MIDLPRGSSVLARTGGRCPDDWRNRFDTDAEADRELERVTSEVGWLTCTVRASIDLARSRSRRVGDVDVWIEVSAADLRFLASSEPDRVTSAYQAAMSPRLSPGSRRSIREQVEMYRDLGIFTDNVTATLALLGEPAGKSTARIRPLVFTGHMIDTPRRASPRFPASRENTAREKITEAISAIKAAADRQGEQLIGMAGATDGGDLLFHEACAELGIDTEVFLPVPELAYRATAMAGRSGWAERYHAALTRAKEKAKDKGNQEDGVHILARADTLPVWLSGRVGYSTWQRSNRWVLHHAWATTTVDRVTVLALWNGEPGDGPGRTADMVTEAQAGGADVIVLETGTIFGLPAPQPQQRQPEPAGAPATPAAADQDRSAGSGDLVLKKVWQTHRQWSAAAGAAEKSLGQWRLGNLALLVLGGRRGLCRPDLARLDRGGHAGGYQRRPAGGRGIRSGEHAHLGQHVPLDRRPDRVRGPEGRDPPVPGRSRALRRPGPRRAPAGPAGHGSGADEGSAGPAAARRSRQRQHASGDVRTVRDRSCPGAGELA